MPNPSPSSKNSNVLKVIRSKILSNKLAYLSIVIDIDNLMWPNFFELAAGLGNSAIQ